MRTDIYISKALCMLALINAMCFAQQPTTEKYCPFLPSSPSTPGHPHPQPRPAPAQVTVTQQGGISVAQVDTGKGCFAEEDPFLHPPGTNFLPTIYTNAFDGSGHEMPNTLP